MGRPERKKELTTRRELLETLKALGQHPGTETAHSAADEALLDYINDPEIEHAYDNVIWGD